jgi:uncharacterized membrane protein
MGDQLSTVALFAATLTAGLSAGLFFTWANAVMPGLRRIDDRAYVAAMQGMNVAIVNPLFLLVFLGAPVLTTVAGALHLAADRRAALPWIVAGLVFGTAVLVITFVVNVPLNNALDAAGEVASESGAAAVRTAFEARWVRWNLVRAIAAAAGFACLAWAAAAH